MRSDFSFKNLEFVRIEYTTSALLLVICEVTTILLLYYSKLGQHNSNMCGHKALLALCVHQVFYLTLHAFETPELIFLTCRCIT